MNEQPVRFKSADLTLEGLIAVPDAPAPAAVICHPHPNYGGSMYNNVVDGIIAGLQRAGYATLRFNFRGVGQSDGEYDGGEGEVDDARAAMAFILSQPNVKSDRAVMAGYSFGAMVAVRAGLSDPAVSCVVAVALPLAMAPIKIPAQAGHRILLVSGDSDSYSPPDKLRALAARITPPPEVAIIAGADHFFGGFEGEIARIVAASVGAV